MKTRRVRYERDSIEFSRVVSLTEGIFAVAMTLLIVSIGIPRVDSDNLADELAALDGDIITFFISVAVLAFYWLSNHYFVRHLKFMDPVYAGLNIVFLALVAFLPFPTALLDRYSEDPVTVVIYLTTLLLISLMEVALFAWAHRQRLFLHDPPPRVVRYGLLMALLPVAVFALAIPVGLLSSPTIALLFWVLLNFPLRFALDRRLGPSSDGPLL